jgi:hypothetical protein
MRAVRLIFCLLPLVGVFTLQGQVFIEVGPLMNERDAFSSVVVYGSDGLQRRIDYSQIKGTPFWSDEWRRGELFIGSDTSLGRYDVKFNLVEQQVHFISRTGTELVPGNNKVSKVIIYSRADSTKPEIIFNRNVLHIQQFTRLKDCYVQELNQGRVRFLKILKRRVETGDSLFGTLKRYFFADQTEYYLQIGNWIEQVKKLNEETLFYLLPAARLYKDWIKEQRVNLKKEEDCTRFIKHFNATEKTAG